MSVSLNSAQGQLIFEGHVITLLSIRACELLSIFTCMPSVHRKNDQDFSCLLASTSIEKLETQYELILFFEREQLVSARLSIEPKHHRNFEGNAFYESTDERVAFHQTWLKKMGIRDGSAQLPWGRIQIGRDKSENVWIQLNIKPGFEPQCS
jgi:hypothetical protein